MPAVTPDMLARAKRLLDDGASYAETARSLGIDASTVRRHLPGYGWTSKQAGDHGMGVSRAHG